MLPPDFRILAEGTVSEPPDLEEIMFKLVEAAEAKAELLLSAGELRVLVEHLRRIGE